MVPFALAERISICSYRRLRASLNRSDVAVAGMMDRSVFPEDAVTT